jgi:hypothetical protein
MRRLVRNFVRQANRKMTKNPFSFPDMIRAVAGRFIAKKTVFITSTELASTASDVAWIDMPHTKRTITTSAKAGIIVDFFGEVASSDSTNQMKIRAIASSLVGNPPVARTGPPVAPGLFHLQAMRFIFEDVPEGTYDVVIQFVGSTGGLVTVGNRTVTVQYR